MDAFFRRLDDNTVAIEIDQNLYQKEAIHAAAHHFTDRSYVHLTRESESVTTVLLSVKESSSDLAALAKEFCTELLDQQVRRNVEKACGNIRDLIVKQAFAPVENIGPEIRL
jgi:His-Xaa-Ser system protein HxsD